MNIKETLKKAAGLIIEFDEEPAAPAPIPEADIQPAPPPKPRTEPQTVEQIVRQAEGPNLDEVKVPPAAPPPALAEGSSPDFTNIYRQANLPASPFSAEQVLELLATFPADLPLETRRQTVKITLSAMAKTMGVTVESIVTDASRKLAALAAFSDNYQRQSTEFVAKSETEIAALQAQIEQKKAEIAKAKQMQAHVNGMCEKESDRLDDVLEFFSLDVPPSKYAPSP